jgi:hypothetical protein
VLSLWLRSSVPLAELGSAARRSRADARTGRRTSVAEPKIAVEHREHLEYLLAEAAQVEHLITCQYLYASFRLKTEPDVGLTAEQAAPVARWYELLTGIAIAWTVAAVPALVTDVGR